MNKVKRRAMSALLVAVLVLGGIGVYIVRYIEHGAEWATFAANSSVYTSGVLSTGTLTDRNGVVLATGQRRLAQLCRGRRRAHGLLSGRRRLHRQRRHPARSRHFPSSSRATIPSPALTRPMGTPSRSRSIRVCA